MCKVKSILLLTLLAISPAFCANIIWVDEGAGGFDEWKTFLEGNGHTVTNMTGMDTLDPGKIDAMNASDLVIVSRDTNSGGYDDAPEPTQWNGLTVPLIQTSSYLIRSSRWLWVNSTGNPAMSDTDNMLIVESHPIFKGVGSAGDEIALFAGSSNITDSTDGGNGQVLGTHTDGRLWIVYWEAEVEFYSGAGQSGAAPRMWFGAAGNEDSGLKGGMNLTEDGQKVFLNAIAFLTGGILGPVATDPSPAVEAVDVYRKSILSWEPGEFAVTHDVYLGTSFADVNDADRANDMGVLAAQGQSDTSLDVGALYFDHTYYWRVDEVNGAPDNTVFKGEIWNFTVEPEGVVIENVTASASGANDEMGPEKTVDGSGLDALGQHDATPQNMWLAGGDNPWIQFDFDKAYKLHAMKVWHSNQPIEAFIGFGVKDLTIEYSVDGATWMPLDGVVTLDKAPGLDSYTGNAPIALGGITAQSIKLTVVSAQGLTGQSGLAEVQFTAIPVLASAPQPADGAVTDTVDVELSWRSGREAVSHEVRLGTDAANLPLLDTTTDAAAATDALDYDTTYAWSVTEVNEAADPTSHAGGVWTFTTPEFGVVDDFESYSGKEGEEVFLTWWDGFGGDASLGGSTTGHFDAPFVETTNVNPGTGGGQALPLYVDNDGGFFDIDGKASAPNFSETLREFSPSQDWTANNIKSLSIMFSGSDGLTGQLYCKIGSTKILYDGDAANLGAPAWQAWNIDLSTVGGNLSSVRELAIGVEGGTSGILFIDDIRLYPKLGELVVPAEPDNANLLAYYTFEGNANDSSGNGLDGAVNFGQIVGPGKLGAGSALYVQQTGYADLGNPAALDFSTGDWTVTGWYKTAMVGTGDANKGTVYAKGGDSGGGHRIALIMSESTEGAVTLVVDDNATKVLAHSASITNDDAWHFVAGQRAGQEIHIYIDGQLEASSTLPDGYDLSGTAQHNAYIGAVTNNGDSSLYKLFNGFIDEVQVHGSALSAGEILWLAGNTQPVHKPF